MPLAGSLWVDIVYSNEWFIWVVWFNWLVQEVDPTGSIGCFDFLIPSVGSLCWFNGWSLCLVEVIVSCTWFSWMVRVLNSRGYYMWLIHMVQLLVRWIGLLG